MCETIDNNTTSRNLDSQTRHVADSQNCKPNKNSQAKPDEGSMSKVKTNISSYLNSSQNKTNIPHYFNSINNKEADKRRNEAITNRMHNEFNILFSGICCFESTFFLAGKREQPLISSNTKKSSLYFTKATEGNIRMARETGNNCPIRCKWNITMMHKLHFGAQS